jgi:hypothetical protein
MKKEEGQTDRDKHTPQEKKEEEGSTAPLPDKVCCLFCSAAFRCSCCGAKPSRAGLGCRPLLMAGLVSLQAPLSLRTAVHRTFNDADCNLG